MRLVYSFLFLFVLGISNCFGQLTDFSLKVEVFDETCLGNGKLIISTTNTAAGSQLTYLTYKLPDVAVPVATDAVADGLSSGNYRVVVTQSLNGQSNSQQKDVTVLNKVQKLDFGLSHTMSDCATATITVNVLSGNAVDYEIVDGPKTFPKQSSNQFENLEEGLYRIKVTDDCGEIDVQDYVILPTDLNYKFDNSFKKVACATITLFNTVNPTNYKFNYPLTATYVIYPTWDPVPFTLTKTIPSGPVSDLLVEMPVAVSGSGNFSYELKITDSCGREFFTNPKITMVSAAVGAKISEIQGQCGKMFFSLNVGNYTPPYTVNFVSAPAGFDPVTYNAAYPGPYTQEKEVYGSFNNPVPNGLYQVEITDACGHKGVSIVKLKGNPAKPLATSGNNGCYSLFGSMYVTVSEKRKIASIIMTAAPAAYAATLPVDFTSSLVAGELTLYDMPVGKYLFTLTDDCGDEYVDFEVEVPLYEPPKFNVIVKPGCGEDFGSLFIVWVDKTTSIVLTSAPAGFGKALPYDLAAEVVNGQISMTDVPAGNYELTLVDICGDTKKVKFKVDGFHQSSAFTVIRNCGSFQIGIDDVNLIEEPGYEPEYWVQKLNPYTLAWEHPYTGVDYAEGSVPNATNSFFVSFGSIALNIAVKGHFRVLKTFKAYANASDESGYVDCFLVLDEFDFTDDLQILGAYNLDCAGGTGASTVVFDVQGVPPYHYMITQKNGLPFSFDNGDNNVFTDLAPGTYNFEITDSCGKLSNGKYTVGALPKLVVANKPGNMLICESEKKDTASFDLSKQTAAILLTQNPSKYEVTYYTTEADAKAGTNAIAVPWLFENTSNPQTLYARVIHKEIDLCYDTTSFEVIVGQKPVPVVEPYVFLCEGAAEVLDAGAGCDSYLWSTGATGPTLQVTQGGTYGLTVKNIYGELSCDATAQVQVEVSGLAKIEDVVIEDWTYDTNSITVKVTGLGDYEFSLNDVDYQDSNLFVNLKTGLHRVYVRDKNGCGTVSREVALLTYLKYFTPNGDGYNDFWRIEFSNLEPGIITYIYDRYGKLITALQHDSPGWDGTFNGKNLPSTDYWFVAERADGKVYKGHFALKR